MSIKSKYIKLGSPTPYRELDSHVSRKFFMSFALFLISVSFFIFQNNQAQAGPNDAIAVRVIENIEFVSPMRWYQRNIDVKGSPSEVMVNGYRGIRDGRSVYVSAANVILNGDPDDQSVNIYILSYTQNADAGTVDIFGQLLENWRFNSNLNGAESSGHCVSASDIVNDIDNNTAPGCEIDYDCGLQSKLYCNSKKAKITRDVQRMADFYEIKYALVQYGGRTADKGYCVNVTVAEGEETQTDIRCYEKNVCPDNPEEYTTYCNYNKYPALTSGSYIKNYSTSIWPSWQNNLNTTLGASLPIDPINRMACSDSGSGNYDPNTCWDDTNQSFGGDLDNNSISYIYTYFYNKADSIFEATIKPETNYFSPDSVGMPAIEAQ